MSDSKLLFKTSKLLSLILRHQPQSIGIQLDHHGWADVAELLANFSKTKHKIDRSLLEEVVATNNKKRFSFNEDGTKIRANQGHSLPVDLVLEKQVPPASLYHGTVEKFIPAILSEGLIKGNRQHVHLSADLNTAEKVGSRRGKPVILLIDAAKAHQDGLSFYLSENGVWLSDHVPAKYLKRS